MQNFFKELSILPLPHMFVYKIKASVDTLKEKCRYS